MQLDYSLEQIAVVINWTYDDMISYQTDTYKLPYINKLVRAKMRPKERTKIEAQREICQICQICRFRFVRFVRFANFRDLRDQPTDRPMDRPSYRDAWTHLKIGGFWAAAPIGDEVL